MGKNVVFLVIFDTCDVIYNWYISLLPPVELDNLFGHYTVTLKLIKLFTKRNCFFWSLIESDELFSKKLKTKK